MKVGHLEIFSMNPIRSQQFYCDVLGFEIVSVQNEQFIWIKKDDLEILIRPGHPPEPVTRYEDTPMGIVLYTSNVEKVLKELVDKGLQVKGTVDSNKCYTFTDPDGNWFQLVDPDDH
jgi:catechol 2,3-dioxygenase-like lactoylglutathione lyase family enzyme